MLITDLMADARRDVRGAADFIVLNALQRACQEFFHQCGGWRQRMDPNVFTPGVFEYVIDIPSGTQVARVENVVLIPATTGTTLAPNSTVYMPLQAITESQFFNLSQQAGTGTPACYAVSESDSVLLFWQTPDATVTSTWAAQVILTATRSIVTLPDAVGTRWREGLIAGAQAFMFNTPGHSWTDAKAGAMKNAIYWDYIARAKRESFSGQFARPMRAQPRRFL